MRQVPIFQELPALVLSPLERQMVNRPLHGKRTPESTKGPTGILKYRPISGQSVMEYLMCAVTIVYVGAVGVPDPTETPLSGPFIIFR